MHVRFGLGKTLRKILPVSQGTCLQAALPGQHLNSRPGETPLGLEQNMHMYLKNDVNDVLMASY